MSDINSNTQTDGGAPGSVGGAAPAGTSVPATAPAGAASSQDVFADLPADQAVFDRGYVDSIRREGQRYRTTAQEVQARAQLYDQVFGGYEEGDRNTWLNLASMWQTDPNQAATIMGNIAKAVLGDADGAETHAAPTGQPAPGINGDGLSAEDAEAAATATGLTPEQVQQMIADTLAEREATQQQEQAVQGVYAEMAAKGYQPDTLEGFMVLYLANQDGTGNVQAGIDKLSAYRQQVVDEYVQGRANGHHPTPSPNGLLPNATPEVHDLEGARKAAEAFIRGQVAAGQS
jgi:hypothetical protein